MEKKAREHLTKKRKKMENLKDKEIIENILKTYEDALNTSDTSKVLPLYSHDGQFIPTQAPFATGQTELKESYDLVFKTIQLNVKFTIEEIVVSGDLAFSRTHSQGTNLVHATGNTSKEENRELFVFQKEAGDWKISRYMFNKSR